MLRYPSQNWAWGMKQPNSKRNNRMASQLRLAPSGKGNGTRPKLKRTRDRVAKKQALVLAALQLFASKGYEVTTTREIAASAGCAEGLIHRYFRGKAGLLAALLETRGLNESAFGVQVQPSPNLKDEFVRMVEQEVERVWEIRDFLRVFIPRAIVDPAVGSVMNKAFISVRSEAILVRLKKYKSCVALPQDAVEILAHSVGALGLLFGFVRPVLLGQDRLRAKKMATTVAKLLVSSSTNWLAA
jgi:AcrR family transcriptional regulator